MKSSKVVLLALIAVAVLFIGGLASRDGGTNPDAQKEDLLERDWMDSLTAFSPRVSAGDVTGPCTDGSVVLTLPRGSSCILQIVGADDEWRQLKLFLAGGERVGLNDGNSESELLPTAQATLAIEAAGGQVTLTCAGREPCRVELR